MPVTLSEQKIKEGALHTALPLPAPHVRQIDGLQVLRAAALLVVVWGHSALPFYSEGMYRVPDLGIYGIDMFFTLSGFILSLVVLRSRHAAGPPAARYFLVRRFIRIFPIYWFFAGLMTVVLLHRHQWHISDYWPALLLAPFPVYPSVHLLVDFSWTLVYEMYFYWLLAGIQLFTTRRAVPCMVAILCGSAALGWWVPVRRPFLVVAANPILLEFVFGALAAMAFTRWGRRRALGIVLFWLGVAGSLGLRFVPQAQARVILPSEHYIQSVRVLQCGIPAALLVAGIAFWLPDVKGRLGQFGVLLGNASYSAYLASGMVIAYSSEFLIRLLSPAHRAETSVRIGMQLTAICLTVGTGLAVYQWVEWPMLRKMQRWMSPGR